MFAYHAKRVNRAIIVMNSKIFFFISFRNKFSAEVFLVLSSFL